MLLLLVALLAVAGPTPRPTSAPTPPNPFTLNPATPASPLPVIGTTRSRPLCAALRQAVAPAIQAAIRNDQAYGTVRRGIFDYVVRDTEGQRDMHLRVMDRTVDAMVKNVDQLQQALRQPALTNPKATGEEARQIHALRDSLEGLLAAQKTQLDATNGFIATEQARRFATPDEGQQQITKAVTGDITFSGPTPPPVTGFIADMKTVLTPQHPTVTTLGDAHKLDRDLGDISAYTNAREEQASKLIVAAANSCK